MVAWVAAVRVLLDPLLHGHAALLLFTFGVVLAAWWGGLGAGLVATAASAAMATALFRVGPSGVAFDATSLGVQILLLVITGAAISALAEAMHRRTRREQGLRQQAHESEGRFAALVRATPLPLVILEYASGRVVDLNDAAVRALGYGRDAAIGATVADLGCFAVSAEYDAMVARLSVDGRVEAADAILRRRDGQSRRYSLSAELIDGPDGRQVVVSAYDVTERIEASDIARRKEAFLRSVLDNLYAFVGVLSPDGTLLEANQAPLRAAGIRFEDVIGRKFWDCYWWNYDPLIQARLRDAIEGAAGGRTYRFDVDVRMAEETRVPIDFMLAPLRDEAGRVTHLIPSAIPIVERRQAEAARRELAAIVESSYDAIIGKTLDGTVTSWNVGAERMFGYPAAEIIGRSIIALVPPGREDEEERFFDALRRGERVAHCETVRLHRDGVPVEVSLSISPIKDDTGQVVGAATIARDVRDQRRAERLLREQATALRDADARKDEFLAMLAHELRNPLAALRTVSYMLSRSAPAPAELSSYGGILARQVGQLTRMVDDLLDISRITRGKIVLDRHPTDLDTILDLAVETTRPSIDARRHRFTVARLDVPVQVDGDATRLSQVIANLLHNAAKYTPEGGRVELRPRVEGGSVEIVVWDDGIGIDPHFLPHVFEPFSQAERGLDRAQGGLGLGLTLARHLAELHGGTLRAFSRGPGSGSEFVLRLPMAVPAAPAATGASADHPAAA